MTKNEIDIVLSLDDKVVSLIDLREKMQELMDLLDKALENLTDDLEE